MLWMDYDGNILRVVLVNTFLYTEVNLALEWSILVMEWTKFGSWFFRCSWSHGLPNSSSRSFHLWFSMDLLLHLFMVHLLLVRGRHLWLHLLLMILLNLCPFCLIIEQDLTCILLHLSLPIWWFGCIIWPRVIQRNTEWLNTLPVISLKSSISLLNISMLEFSVLV